MEIVDLILPIRREYDRAVTYGNSMGAYGALLISRAIQATDVIAFAPQYTVDATIMPEERRWLHATGRSRVHLSPLLKRSSLETSRVLRTAVENGDHVQNGKCSSCSTPPKRQADAAQIAANLASFRAEILRRDAVLAAVRSRATGASSVLPTRP